jgi:hypothetical protein
MIITINCPCCTQKVDHESMFTVRAGDCFNCTCGKKLVIKVIGNPPQVEEVKAIKYSILKDKK